MVFSWLFRGPLLSRKTVFGPFARYFFVAFSWPPFWANFTRTRPGTVFWNSNSNNNKIRKNNKITLGRSQSTTLFGGPPFSIKHPQDNFSLQNANWRPPKCKLARGDFCVFLYKNCRLEVANPFLEGVNLHFGGCQFTFWRLKLSWGCFIEKGWYPKRVVLWFSATHARALRDLTSRFCTSHRIAACIAWYGPLSSSFCTR